MLLLTIVPVAPLRAMPAHKSEMVSQLLFGETAEQLAEEGDFYLVKCSYDGYEGWIQKRQTTRLNESPDYHGWVAKSEEIVFLNNQPQTVPPGSVLPSNGQFTAGPYQCLCAIKEDLMSSHHWPVKGDEVVHWAKQYLGAAYLWGGKSIWGTDCSGLVQMAFKMAGILLPRDACQQAERGEGVGFLQEARAGDLAFFDNAEGRITHVGILLNPVEILHASANIRIDPVDHQGIVHAETGERTHRLRIIKRLF